MGVFIPFANNRLVIWLQIGGLSLERVIVAVNKVSSTGLIDWI